MFDYFDKDGSGELDHKEMVEMAAYINITKACMNDIIKEIDFNGDGNISFQEWCDYIINIQTQLAIQNHGPSQQFGVGDQ